MPPTIGNNTMAAIKDKIIVIAAINSINARCGKGSPLSVTSGTDKTPAIVTAPRTPVKPEVIATRHEAVSCL